MDYLPRYRQPFTFAQAVQLDIPTILQGLASIHGATSILSDFFCTEITRLEHSLEHLVRTQHELRHHLATEGEGDEDLNAAVKENDTVMQAVLS